MISSRAPHLVTGNKAEEIAFNYLSAKGLLLVEKNFRSRYGEIDLIMREGEILIFVEVRYRNTDRYGDGAESVTTAKQNRIIRTANHFLTIRKLDNNLCRFDVVSASNLGNSKMQIEWIKDAFEE